jgi:stage V sporulation protein G
MERLSAGRPCDISYLPELIPPKAGRRKKGVISMQENTIQVNRIHRMDGDSKLKAFVDISLSGVIVKGLRVVDGANGLFVGMPRHQGKDGKWYNTVYPETDQMKQELNDLVLSAYNEEQ